MGKTVRALVLAVLLLLAGCSGVIDQPQEPEAPTGTTPVNETTTRSPGTATTVEPSQVVAYDELTAEQQAAFQNALQGEATFVPDSPYIDEPAGYEMSNSTLFERNEYVRYNGDLYDIGLGLGKAYAIHTIMAVTGDPPENATVIALENVSANASDVLRTTLTDGRYESGMGEWPDGLPGRLGTLEYVRYEDETYELTYGIGEEWAKVLTVKRVE